MFPYINDQIKMTIQQQQHCKLHSENCTQKQKYKILLSDAPQRYMYNVKWHRQALLILPAKSFQFDQWWLPVSLMMTHVICRQACSYSLRYRVETTNIMWTICTDIYISTTNADITQYTSCTNISAVYPVYTIYVHALTFAGLDRLSRFSDQQPFMKVSSRESLDQFGNESVFVRRFHHNNAKMAAIC